MKAVILAGGVGSRLGEETERRPKPMVEIGGQPILWHIMKHLAHYGINEFVIALGYRGDMIKKYFLEYAAMSHDIMINTATGEQTPRPTKKDEWTVALIDTGLTANTAWRLKQLAPILREPFLVAYGDSLSDVDVGALVAFHQMVGRYETSRTRPWSLATLTAVHPPARYGALTLGSPEAGQSFVEEFAEKVVKDSWINGGYIVFDPQVFDHGVFDDVLLGTDLSGGVLARLAPADELRAYRHNGFWLGMDTLRDKQELERLWASGNAPWKVWEG